MLDLDRLIDSVRSHPGLREKEHLRAVSRLFEGDGGDAAVVPVGDEHLVSAAEAITPDLVRAAPRVAGIAGVVATLNDLAAAGADPLFMLDTVVGDPELLDEVLGGVRAGMDLFRVPVLGGHTTVTEAGEIGLSVFAVGRAARPLRVSRAAPGDVLSVAICTDGEVVEQGAMPFFSHLRGPRRDRAREDLRLLTLAAESGEAWAARDVSMPGLAGSLVQMLDGSGLGCRLSVDAVPRPASVAPELWFRVFMSYGFLLVGNPDALQHRFAGAGIACAPVGALDDSGVVRLHTGDREAMLWDLTREPLTGFSP